MRPASLLLRLLPLVCLCCGQRLEGPRLEPALCRWCLERLPWIPVACERCGLALPAGSDCRRCADWTLDRTIVPLSYKGPVVTWVLRAKRSGGLPEARLLGRLLAVAALDRYGHEELPDGLVPVPLSWRRMLARGHNQAEQLAREASRGTGTPVLAGMVRRLKNTRRQPGLTPAARAANVAGAFALHKPDDARQLTGRHVAVVDDVMTSGATVLEISRLLLAAGCRRVDAWCAARAEPT
jgi:ComF family protein